VKDQSTAGAKLSHNKKKVHAIPMEFVAKRIACHVKIQTRALSAQRKLLAIIRIRSVLNLAQMGRSK